MTQAYIEVRPGRDALAGVRTRRLMALAIDFVVVSVIASLVYVLLFVLTVGLSFFFLPPLWPIIAFFYNGVSMSGSGRGTPGMRALDLQIGLYDSAGPAPFLNAAAHGVLFYLTWFLPPLFLVTLVDRDKRFLHDILSGLVVTRRF
jgi:uncharacterized RDD family membrane protein YckC